MEVLPDGMVLAVLRCSERPEGASPAHVVPEDLSVALCGRTAWKAGMYFQEIYSLPSVKCGVCEEKAKEMFKCG